MASIWLQKFFQFFHRQHCMVLHSLESIWHQKQLLIKPINTTTVQHSNQEVNKGHFLSIANVSHLKYGRIKDKYISKTSCYPNRTWTWWSMYSKHLATHWSKKFYYTKVITTIMHIKIIQIVTHFLYINRNRAKSFIILSQPLFWLGFIL
jgi:hypothetical protein